MIDLDDPTTWPLGIYTCHNRQCENRGIRICLQVPQAPTSHRVLCGVCGNDINDRRSAPDGVVPGVVE